jgi:hypothetical protein
MGKVLIFRRKKQNEINYRRMFLFATVFAVVMTAFEQTLKPYYPSYYGKIYTDKGEEDCNYRGSNRRENCLIKVDSHLKTSYS